MSDFTQRRGDPPPEDENASGATPDASRIGDDTAGATRADAGGTSGGSGTAGGSGGASGRMSGTGDDVGESSDAGWSNADITES
jgi:hypothetical protein